jgi:NTE family protein
VVTNRALVLGGGGIAGVGWLTGLIAGLAGAGVDLTTADLIVGTAAGAVAGAMIRSPEPLESLYERQLALPRGEIAATLGAPAIARMTWIMLTSPDQVRARARIGAMAGRASTVAEADRRAVLAARLPAADWPERPLQITAVDATSGEFVVFDRAGQASLLDAVTASCAVPGVWPPATIGGRRYIDGSMRSPANADLAAGYDQVVILSPVSAGSPRIASPHVQASELRSAGAEVSVVVPDAAARRAISTDLRTPARRAAAARAGRVQARAAAAIVRPVWSG